MLASTLQKDMQTSWDHLERLVQKGYLAAIDLLLAQTLLCPNNLDIDEGCAAVICHLSAALRQGHLCIEVSEATISPDISAVWVGRSDTPQPPPAEELDFLRHLVKQGAKALPALLCEEVSHTSLQIPSTPLCRWGSLFYFQRYWLEERSIVVQLQRWMGEIPSLTLDPVHVQEQLQGLPLLPEQVAAIESGCRSCLTVLCGGPGTGKTYTAAQFVKVYWEAMTHAQRARCNIVLAAPTGKAAAHLQKGLLRAIGSLENFPPIQAKTIHSLLAPTQQTRLHTPEQHKITADLVIIDESSMVDAQMMGRLLAAIPSRARILLIGDPGQLPPVATGAPFTEIIRILERCHPRQVVRLKTSLRTELRSLVHFAEAMQAGKVEEVLNILSDDSGPLSYRPLPTQPSDTRKMQRKLIDTFFSRYSTAKTPLEALQSMSTFALLSPVRKGAYGVDTLNTLFYAHALQQTPEGQDFMAPLILVHTDNRLRLYNGQAGILVRRRSGKSHINPYAVAEGDYALFPEQGGKEPFRRIPALLLPPYEYAYCLSVHKSQGSEFDEVLLLMPTGAEVFGREIMYTAATRARKKLEIWGDLKTIGQAIERIPFRMSGCLAAFKEG